MIIAIIYIIPCILFIFLLAPKLLEIRREFKGASSKDEQAEIIKDLKEKYNKSVKFNVTISELKKLKPIFISQLWLILQAIFFIFMFPIFMLRMSFFLRWGTKLSWLLPVSFYEIWQLLFLALSYYYSFHKSSILGIVLAAIVGISALYNILSDLEMEGGSLKILQYPTHKLNLRGIIESGIIFVLSYSAIFYALSIMESNTFSSRLSILDSIYFSIITVATVGYGDINPISSSAKILVISEILLGILYMLFIVSTFLSVFLKRHIEEMDVNNDHDNIS